MAMEIGDMSVEKSNEKVNSMDITIDLWINAMRTEGVRVIIITTTIITSTIIELIDTTIVNVSINTMSGNLGASPVRSIDRHLGGAPGSSANGRDRQSDTRFLFQQGRLFP